VAFKTILETDVYFERLELDLGEVDLQGVDCVIKVHSFELAVVGVQSAHLVVNIPVSFLS
jgi:hypothetical protein